MNMRMKTPITNINIAIHTKAERYTRTAVPVEVGFVAALAAVLVLG